MTDITEQGPRGGALIYTESAYKSGQMKARGAIVADMLMELQAVESQSMRHGELYSPRLDLTKHSDEYREGFLRALQHMRVRFEDQHHGATREAKKLIANATSEAYALVQCAHALIELARERGEDV